MIDALYVLCVEFNLLIFFFKQKTAYEMRISDWSSDVCSSDLKLGFKQARELEQLPARIEALEMRIAELTAAMNDPAFYQRDSAAINAHNAVVAEAQAELDAAYARWEALEDS